MCSSNKKAHQSRALEGPLRGAGELVTELVPMDVLCGKSRKCITHEGTRLFRVIIEQNRVKYEQTKSKQERMQITKEIVAYIHQNGGRFLKFNSAIQCWENIGALAARDKVSHALRCANQRSKSSSGRRSPSSSIRSLSPSVASDAASLASRTGPREDLFALQDMGIGVSESLEAVIGDQQSILSCFSSPQGMTELPAAHSLTDIFEDEAKEIWESNNPFGQSDVDPFSGNTFRSTAMAMHSAESLLPVGLHHQRAGPDPVQFPALHPDMSTDNLPLGRINWHMNPPSQEEDTKEEGKRQGSFFQDYHS